LKRYLVLGDGSVFTGFALGATGESVGEVVFNTGMTGYQEILTDPSYAGQLVTLTYPLIGNYGINEDDFESDRLQASGLIVREACDFPSNWRVSKTLDELLKERNLMGISGVDTRALTKRIRSAGVTMGMLTDDDPAAALARLQSSQAYDDRDFVETVTTTEPYSWGYEGKEAIDAPMDKFKYRVAVLDCGLKFNILRRFATIGAKCLVMPAHSTADEILALNPDGVLLSPGPGDPARLGKTIETVRNLLGEKPIFGICLGNQLLCHAIGGKTFKMPFGHRGSNHPVLEVETGKVTITSQNHGYAIDPASLEGTGAVITHRNLNDGTVEGISLPAKGANSIQYHPEAAPGPWDSRPHFARFISRLAG
jgi:carbamoyl-phosphate synthase small subunit